MWNFYINVFIRMLSLVNLIYQQRLSKDLQGRTPLEPTQMLFGSSWITDLKDEKRKYYRKVQLLQKKVCAK